MPNLELLLKFVKQKNRKEMSAVPFEVDKVFENLSYLIKGAEPHDIKDGRLLFYRQQTAAFRDGLFFGSSQEKIVPDEPNPYFAYGYQTAIELSDLIKATQDSDNIMRLFFGRLTNRIRPYLNQTNFVLPQEDCVTEKEMVRMAEIEDIAGFRLHFIYGFTRLEQFRERESINGFAFKLGYYLSHLPEKQKTEIRPVLEIIQRGEVEEIRDYIIDTKKQIQEGLSHLSDKLVSEFATLIEAGRDPYTFFMTKLATSRKITSNSLLYLLEEFKELSSHLILGTFEAGHTPNFSPTYSPEFAYAIKDCLTNLFWPYMSLEQRNKASVNAGDLMPSGMIYQKWSRSTDAQYNFRRAMGYKTSTRMLSHLGNIANNVHHAYSNIRDLYSRVKIAQQFESAREIKL